jgi:hypothetical protein
MVNPNQDEEARGKVDAVAVLYIVGGIPAIWAFIIVLFSAVKACNIPA